MRHGDWNQKNRELYEATVNRTNNTCTLNPYRTKYLELTNNIMTFDLFSIELHRHAQSWIGVLGFNARHHLFYIEWSYEGKIENVEVLWLFDWNRAR